MIETSQSETQSSFNDFDDDLLSELGTLSNEMNGEVELDDGLLNDTEIIGLKILSWLQAIRVCNHFEIRAYC